MYGERYEWNPAGMPQSSSGTSSQHLSTYTTPARSESPSIYSRRDYDSPASSYDDVSYINPRFRKASMHSTVSSQIAAPTQASKSTTSDSLSSDDGGSDVGNHDDPAVLQDSSDHGLSGLGPKTRVYSRAPWETGEDDAPDSSPIDDDAAETRSIFGSRGRSKKPKETAGGISKGLGFAASLAAMTGSSRAPSSSRPSTDTTTSSFVTPFSPASAGSNGTRPSYVGSSLRRVSTATTMTTMTSASVSNVSDYASFNPLPKPANRDRSPASSIISPIQSKSIPPFDPILRSHQSISSNESHAARSSSHTTPKPPTITPLLTEPLDDKHQRTAVTTPTANLPPSRYGPAHSVKQTESGLSPSVPYNISSPMPASASSLPQKLAPWQNTPTSPTPTFQLLTLEEAQAMQAKQRLAAAGTSMSNSAPSTPYPTSRGRTVSASAHLSSSTSAAAAGNQLSQTPHIPDGHHSPMPTGDGAAPGKERTIKARRSLMGLFGKNNKDKDKLNTFVNGFERVSPRTESPPPVPSLPIALLSGVSGIGDKDIVAAQSSGTIREKPKRVPPPLPNVTAGSYVDNSLSSPKMPAASSSTPSTPPSQITGPRSQPHSASIIHPAVSPSSVKPLQPRKKGSSATLAGPPSSNKFPGLPPRSFTNPRNADLQNNDGFQKLNIRPVSTMFSSLPADYLAIASPNRGDRTARIGDETPTTPGFGSASGSGSGGSVVDVLTPSSSVFTGVNVTTPTPGYPVHNHPPTINGPDDHVLSQLRSQVLGAKESWKSQVEDLERQVAGLKREIEELRQEKERWCCTACGARGEIGLIPLDEMPKKSVVHRPRAKTTGGGGRFANGGE